MDGSTRGGVSETGTEGSARTWVVLRRRVPDKQDHEDDKEGEPSGGSGPGGERRGWHGYDAEA